VKSVAPAPDNTFNTLTLAPMGFAADDGDDARHGETLRALAEGAAAAEAALVRAAIRGLPRTGDAHAEVMERHRAIREHLTAIARLGGFCP
jgi:hypothetical protein